MSPFICHKHGETTLKSSQNSTIQPPSGGVLAGCPSQDPSHWTLTWCLSQTATLW